MKLRIRGDSLRLRLTRSEVETLGSGGRVEQAMHVAPGQMLSYTVLVGDVTRPCVRLLGTAIEVVVPAAQARSLAQTEQVSLEAEQDAGEASLKILIEKDFQCLAPRGGDEDADAFPHPDSNRSSC